MAGPQSTAKPMLCCGLSETQTIPLLLVWENAVTFKTLQHNWTSRLPHRLIMKMMKGPATPHSVTGTQCHTTFRVQLLTGSGSLARVGHGVTCLVGIIEPWEVRGTSGPLRGDLVNSDSVSTLSDFFWGHHKEV